MVVLKIVITRALHVIVSGMGPGPTNSYVDSRAEYEKWKTVGYVVIEIDHVHTTISSGLIAVRLSIVSVNFKCVRYITHLKVYSQALAITLITKTGP